jgi:hypothetical protein
MANEKIKDFRSSLKPKTESTTGGW